MTEERDGKNPKVFAFKLHCCLWIVCAIIINIIGTMVSYDLQKMYCKGIQLYPMLKDSFRSSCYQILAQIKL